MTPTIEQLVNIGGTEWQKHGKHRIYFNDLLDLYGLELTAYGTGRISSAKLDGDEISNSAAAKLVADLRGLKFWYDVQDGAFRARYGYGQPTEHTPEEYCEFLADGVRGKIETSAE